MTGRLAVRLALAYLAVSGLLVGVFADPKMVRKEVRSDMAANFRFRIPPGAAPGTFDEIVPKLGYLQHLGINAIEIMPVADFPGHFGWGYDGVDLFAPTRLYGEPDDFRSFTCATERTDVHSDATISI